MTNIKYYLREWRLKKAMSQEELGAKSGVDPSTIGDIENNPTDRRRGSTIRALAGALGLDAEDLTREPYDKPIVGHAIPPLPRGLADRLRQKFVMDGKEYRLDEDDIEELMDWVRFRKRKG